MNKAIFFDRDGVINEDTHYVHKISEFKFKKDIFSVMTHLKKLGYIFFIVTNQSGINRHYFSIEDYTLMTNYMINELSKKDIEITKIYMCPHTPAENCTCRKPHPTFINDAVNTYNLNVDKCWLIGDKDSDIQCGLNAGLSNLILINENDTPPQSNINVIKTLSEITHIIQK